MALKKLLFVCVGNSCRSQMAEGFARFYGGDVFEVRSAGTSAAGYVSGPTIDAMKERGIDITGQTSKQLTAEMIDWADVVVTLGCCSADEFCPVSYKGRKLDWSIEDPVGMPQSLLRKVRDGIEERVRGLIESEKQVSP